VTDRKYTAPKVKDYGTLAALTAQQRTDALHITITGGVGIVISFS
jgi:hypothetical protein